MSTNLPVVALTKGLDGVAKPRQLLGFSISKTNTWHTSLRWPRVR